MKCFCKKSHSCEEGGAHLRISFWHLLMNFEKPKKSEFWKNEKKLLDIFYTWVPKTTIIWGTYPEIRNEMIFFHFRPFFTLYPSPPLPYNPENQNFEKMKKASGDVIILNLCNKKHNHMMYAYSDMECDDIIFCYFRLFFCSFTPLLTPKIKIWKKCKKHLEILSFYTCVP